MDIAVGKEYVADVLASGIFPRLLFGVQRVDTLTLCFNKGYRAVLFIEQEVVDKAIGCTFQVIAKFVIDKLSFFGAVHQGNVCFPVGRIEKMPAGLLQETIDLYTGSDFFWHFPTPGSS
ncbi:MAG: hypothetical protein EHM36_10360 [Deltaproteobacteria bacterium]|nr:MAG: hypothetical protein EHM36_10360 [Deltaproteobacteria bacterium]